MDARLRLNYGPLHCKHPKLDIGKQTLVALYLWQLQHRAECE